MRFLIQRVREAHVSVDGVEVGRIGPGLLVLVGIAPNDTFDLVTKMVAKTINLRIFEDATGKMNLSLLELHTRQPNSVSILAISQFTLFADCRKGRRPSFTDSAPPGEAELSMGEVVAEFARTGLPVQTGTFGAHMLVALENVGPVTIMLDSADVFPATN